MTDLATRRYSSESMPVEYADVLIDAILVDFAFKMCLDERNDLMNSAKSEAV